MPEKSEILLEVRNLKKDFPLYAGIIKRQVGSIKAVNGIDFFVRTGEVLGVVGESGSGKSTAARAAIRLIEPSSGEITFEGDDLLAKDKEQLRLFRRQVQMVFQDPYSSLNPRKPVGESIGEALVYHNLVASEEEKEDRVAAVLDMVGLSPDVTDRYPHEFSGGQQQRICIGRAIACNPKLIICDEAVSALDVSVQAQILNLFSLLRKSLNLSYLFISHDLSVIRYSCDRVVVMYLGKVMESASVEELFSNPKHPYTLSLLSAVPKTHPREKKERIILRGEVPSAANPPSGCPFRTRCPYAKPICAEPPPQRRVHGSESHDYFCILD